LAGVIEIVAGSATSPGVQEPKIGGGDPGVVQTSPLCPGTTLPASLTKVYSTLEAVDVVIVAVKPHLEAAAGAAIDTTTGGSAAVVPLK
jgi:hypothetical protein